MNKIIFFINCHVNSKYESLLNIYLDDFKNSGIEQRKDVRLIFVVVGKPDDYLKVRQLVENKLPGIFNDYNGKNILTSSTTERVEFRVFDNSNYEHMGIETVWKESMTSDDDDLITYTHCRGLGHTNSRQPEMNNSREVHSYFCGKLIIREYNKVEMIFKNNKEIKKVGLCQSPLGWMWFNFWTVKASYLKTRPRPLGNPTFTNSIKENFPGGATNRHYYEAWLGDGGEENESGYSLLVPPHKGVYLSGQEVLNKISKIRGNRLHI